MSFWIWYFGFIVITYVVTMDIKNLIRIEPSVVSHNDIEAVGKNGQAFRECIHIQATNINWIEYNCDKLQSIVRKVG